MNNFSPIPFRCPTCGAQLVAPARSPAADWRCTNGHVYPTTRSLIADLLAAGWRPQIEMRQQAR